MTSVRQFLSRLTRLGNDQAFLAFVKYIESGVSKVLGLAMVIVVLVAVVDLCLFLVSDLLSTADRFFATTLFEIFGLFLNILIALEVLENITAYLRKHVVQVELVIVTSLTAVARKIIIFDFSKATGIDLIGLAVATLALSISYLIIRNINTSEDA
ncbi:phosphate-starvation-inducible PsiE family protein [Leptolyngbya sp. CCY15150]|uniref:phosphate-starvation-inducible PsiE family protein n=1 Tax=Leptolyngbya sp. CCY15150 TaxID=2767772 RepID=UPI0019524BBC|nr:phosphate-starvation-inducible PsiE family protein [Leptolyngbya sp. CCY15150]